MKIIRREKYFNQLINLKDKHIIKVLTGIRKCGKSEILKDFMMFLKNDDNNLIIYYDFNIVKNTLLFPTFKELIDDIDNRINVEKNRKVYLFIDEVQECYEFEKVLNNFYSSTEIDIYVTGSNSKMLSTEISTLLTGVNHVIKVSPFVFEEFVKFYGSEYQVDFLFENFVKLGSMPGRLIYEINDEMNITSYLNMVYSNILENDVLKRFHIRDVEEFKKIFVYLLNNIGKKISIENIRKFLFSNNKSTISFETINNYIYWLKNCYLIRTVDFYSQKTKEIMSSGFKPYSQDLGFVYSLSNSWESIQGFILENIVFLQLQYLDYEVFSINDSIRKIDIDFRAKKGKEVVYIKVTERITEENKEREIGNLERIKDSFKKIVLILQGNEFTSESGIKIIKLKNWLLNSSKEIE